MATADQLSTTREMTTSEKMSEDKVDKILSILDEVSDDINRATSNRLATNLYDNITFAGFCRRETGNISLVSYQILNMSQKNRFTLKRHSDLVGEISVPILPDMIPVNATLYMSGDEGVYTPVKSVSIDGRGCFSFFECPFPICCFPFEKWSVEIEYVPSPIRSVLRLSVRVEHINTPDRHKFADKIYQKFEEQNLYRLGPPFTDLRQNQTPLDD